MKFCLFFLCCWCLNVEWRSSWVSYCPENHEIFQAADMACQDFESLHWKSLYPGRMNYLREYQDCYLLCWKVSKSWDSEFDFSPVFTFILKYEIIQSLTNIQISYWNNSNIYIYIYISQIISYSSTSVIEIGKFSLTTIIQNLFLRIFLSSVISLPKSS